MNVQDLDKPVSSAVLGAWLGISRQAVDAQAKAGVIARSSRGFDLPATVRQYCEHLRATAARWGGDRANDLTAERARLAREQADGHALKNAQLRGELVEVAEAEREWNDTLRSVRSCLLAVPSRVRQRLGHLSAADVEVIDREVRDVLEEAAGADASPPAP